MKAYIETSAKSLEEAIAIGLQELQATEDQVEVTILDEGSKGLFGLFGSKQARVALKLKNAAEEVKEEKTCGCGHKKEVALESSCCCGHTAEETECACVKEECHCETSAETANTVDTEAICKLAKEFLQEVTTKMGCEVEITPSFREDGTLFIDMHGDELGILIGRHGETLDALQYITRLAVNKDSDDFIRVVLDSEGYRAKREESLVRLANRMANRAIKTGRRVSLEPMNPYERRIMHAALQGNTEIETHSEGEEPRRHLVITPKR